MVCCKLLVIATILFFGEVSGQLRVQRHLGTTATTTQNGKGQGLTGMSGLSYDGELVSDNGDVVLQEPHVTVDVELLIANGKLILEICSDGCLNKEVTVCFDAAPDKYNKDAIVGCGENQCGFKAGVHYKNKKNSMRFMVTTSITEFIAQTCGQAVMAFPITDAISSETGKDVTINSCEPEKHDGNVVRLYVKQAYTGCSIKVKNAKIWYPTTAAPLTTAPPPSLLSTPLSSSNATESSSSNAETTWWIIGGVLGGFAALLIVGFIGCCVYRRHQQKKSAAEKEQADRKRRVISPESLPTLDLSPYIQKEEEMPKKEVDVKKDNTEKKKKNKKAEAAPAPAKVLPSKEGTIEDKPKVEPLKEKAAAEIQKVQKEKPAAEVKEVQKEKKAPVAKEGSKRAKKVAKKDVAVATPPPPPRRKAATPKQRSVDATQEESPSSGRQQDAVDDGSSSPSAEKKPPAKKPAPKKAPAKKTRDKNPLLQPPLRSASRRPRRNRASKDLPQYGLNTEEWEDFEAQQESPLGKVVEWNAKSSKSLY